jgi:hypothetical protein
MLKISGIVFLVIGIAAGVTLILSPFGPVGAGEPLLAAWLLFPGGFAAGSLLFALSASSAALVRLWSSCAALLLALACAAAIGLILPVLGLVEPTGHTLSLWYVLVVSGGVGTACALVPNQPGAASV